MRDNFALKLAAMLFLLTALPGSNRAALGDVLEIKGDGSTFASPMYAKWFEEYGKVDPNVRFTYVSNGSGAGIHDVMIGTVDFAGTDGPLNNVQMLDFSAHRNCELLHFPTALGADVPVFNLAGIRELNFTPQALAGIYLGKITTWNSPEIAKVNANVSLPADKIVVVHRQDGSGTTYVWTDYLSKVSPEWHELVGTGVSVSWPLGIAGKGNQGVAELVEHTPNSIGYTELTYAVGNGLSYGSVTNRSGQLIKANTVSVTAAAAEAAESMSDDFRASITDAPGKDAYPIYQASPGSLYLRSRQILPSGRQSSPFCVGV
jgi:phosphate transport system substrate-binding protein